MLSDNEEYEKPQEAQTEIREKIEEESAQTKVRYDANRRKNVKYAMGETTKEI